jgi:cardiolipin synthase
MVAHTDVVNRLAQLALMISDTSSADAICEALGAGQLNRESTSAARAAVAGGNTAIENHLRTLQTTWRIIDPEVSGPSLALVLRTSMAAASATGQQAPVPQVVWTGPRVEGSFLRATREVVREILRAARQEILVVGYWIAARDDGEGIIEELIAAVADAIARGVKARVIVDERARPDGRDNRSILISAWPVGVPLPKILTWRLPAGDQHLKLHAKVLVADRSDALVTSANLTSYAMDRNMEMGVRVVGRPAMDIAAHFDLLEAQGVIERFDRQRQMP